MGAVGVGQPKHDRHRKHVGSCSEISLGACWSPATSSMNIYLPPPSSWLIMTIACPQTQIFTSD